jgi:hypothetical protein
MFSRNDKLVIAGLSALAVSNFVDAIKIRRHLKQADAKLQESTLNLAATRQVHDMMKKRLEEGYYDNNPNFYTDYVREIEFAKIALRLQD